MTRRTRSDAIRNRQRILDSAAELFAERGLGVSLDTVADQAGVGVGTVYRHFTAKREVIDIVYADRLDLLVSEADIAMEHPDPWRGLENYVEHLCREIVLDRGLRETTVPWPGPDIHTALSRVVDHAKAAGVIRSDVYSTDILVLIHMVASIADIFGAAEPNIWYRYLALILDAIRFQPIHPLPIAEFSDTLMRSSKDDTGSTTDT